jgi:MORN repeat variant
MNDADRAYYKDGQLRAEGTIVNGEPHGIHRQWHPNGVLAQEIPYNHGIIDGTVQQWDKEGKLVATSEIKKGTGVLRTIDLDQGIDGEMAYVDGKMTGRQLTYCGGELMGIVYWLENRKVSRKRYLLACDENPRFPRYGNDEKLGPTWLSKVQKAQGSAPEIVFQADDTLPLKLLKGSNVREALSWLEESCEPERSLGEASSQEESIRLVKELYDSGAASVHAVEINGTSTQDQNSGRLVIELPKDHKARQKLFNICKIYARKQGFDPDQDLGQQYLLLMLD